MTLHRFFIALRDRAKPRTAAFVFAAAVFPVLFSMGGCASESGLRPGEAIVDDVKVGTSSSSDAVCSWAIGYPRAEDVTATLFHDGRLIIDGRGNTLRFVERGEVPGQYITAPAPWCDTYGLAVRVVSADITEDVEPRNIGSWFDGCSRLSSWPTWGGSTGIPGSVEHLKGLFSGCKGLSSSIPGNLFEKCSKVTDFIYVFSECSSISGTIPEELFLNCPRVERFYGVFSGCEKLSGPLPESLFSSNAECADFGFAFSGCKGLSGSLPERLFSHNTVANNFSGVFWGCSGLRGPIPAELFGACQNAESFVSTFEGCIGITEVDQDFWLPESMEDAEGMFSDSRHAEPFGSGNVVFDHDPIPTVYEGDNPAIEALLFDGTNRVRVE